MNMGWSSDSGLPQRAGYEAGLNEQDLDGQNQGNQRMEGRASEHL